MMDVKTQVLDVSGLDALTDGLSRLEAWAESDVLKAGGRAVAQAIVDKARELVPERTGKLRSAIRVRAGRSSGGSFSFLASASSKLFSGEEYYGAFQEFGWKSGSRKSANRVQHPGEHYLQTAAEEVGPGALDVFVAKVKAGIAKELGGTP